MYLLKNMLTYIIEEKVSVESEDYLKLQSSVHVYS